MNIPSSGLGSILTAHRNVMANMNRNFEILSSGTKLGKPKNNPVAYKEIELHNETFRKLEVFSNNLHSAGATVGIALSSMTMADEQLKLMEQKLRDAFFYPEGSEDRAHHLREYNRMLPLIDDIAQAPDAGARRLLDSPDDFPEAGDIFVKIAPEGQQLRLRAQQIRVGEDGLDVRLIDNPEATNDDTIREEIVRLELARETLLDKSKALGVDASTIEKSLNFNGALMNQHQLAAARLDDTDLNREAILSTSLKVRQELALNSIQSVLGNREMALQLLR